MASIEAIYLLNSNGSAIVQLESQGRTSATVASTIWSEITRWNSNAKALPFVLSAKSIVFFQRRVEDVHICISIINDTDPLFISDIMDHIVQTLKSYFGGFKSTILEAHSSTIIQILLEMIDNGYPAQMEACSLEQLVPLPSLMNKIMNATRLKAYNFSPLKQPMGSSSVLQSYTKHNSVPWRAADVKHSTNEFFVHVVDFLKATVDAKRRTVSGSVLTRVECRSRLSGTPDLSMVLQNASKLQSPFFHRCVNLQHWKQNHQQIQFIPPDGKFTLCSFASEFKSVNALPVVVDAKLFNNTSFEISLRASSAKSIENILVRIPAKFTLKNLKCTSGDFFFSSKNILTEDPELHWSIKKLERASPAITLKGELQESKILLPNGDKGDERSLTHLVLEYAFPLSSSNQLKIDNIRVLNQKESKPFKGIKYSTLVRELCVRFQEV
ncbi:AP-3 adaptor complex subunit Apm3 [Schizosaccharomyces japonicus yFS275]|uniref:AP-3 adaptor complex subunit Apm3 n=1 Tax=Schizosaccharomyces japonicus (strain yFS275 / FY16936) TaxID=402676 RepID=B6K854_SCHJY|nr:AP-3 adaptor complex subunit Apm3 [Schizosaccharomyces japonicus yFS275]EEB09708.1 AP-3 adaptor complex subunit Apm3 [Schizosaccharomyces japonicus yFS275]